MSYIPNVVFPVIFQYVCIYKSWYFHLNLAYKTLGEIGYYLINADGLYHGLICSSF
jgi:hypothetical protein